MSNVTPVGLCSNALLQLGDVPIASFDEATDRARLCANLWPMVRDDFLRKHTWACTRKRVILAPEATAPEFDWGYQFLLPGDWVRTLQVGSRSDPTPYEMTGRQILADTNTLRLVYVWRNEDTTQWDDAMVDAACAEMAARMAYPITKSNSLAQEMKRAAMMAMKVAKATAGQDNEPETWGDSPFIEVRGG